MVIRAARLVAIAGCLGTGLLPSAEAGPLEAEQCEKITAQLASLDQTGVKTVLEKGPAAARGTLTKEQRDQVRTYLDVLGQLRFRCPNDAPLVTLKPEAPDDPADAGSATAPIEAGSPGITLPAGVAAAVIAPVVPKKPAAAKSEGGGVEAKKKPAPKGPPAKAAAATPAATVAAPTGQPGAEVKPAPAKALPAPTKAAAPQPKAAATDPAAAPAAKSKSAPRAKPDDAFRPSQPPDAKPQ